MVTWMHSAATIATATPIARRVCGGLDTPSDVDWVTLELPRGATTVRLTAEDDAVFAIGTLAFGRCTLLASGKKGARVTTSARTTSLCARISSPAQHAQTYTFTAR